jgi:hypothetical protein
VAILKAMKLLLHTMCQAILVIDWPARLFDGY